MTKFINDPLLDSPPAEILICDRYCAGSTSTTFGINNPLNFTWKNIEEQYGNPEILYSTEDNLVIYTEQTIYREDKIGKIKIAWMLEPEEYLPHSYEWIKENHHEFDYVFTWQKKLLSIDPKFIFLKPGNSWIKRADTAIYPKTKLCSMIASGKEFMFGHKIRREIFRDYANYFDQYGKDTNPLDYVLDAYKDYMFTVVVENVKQDYMFSEKLITPLLCGTVPIYWGCPSIGKFFDLRGMIIIDNPDLVGNILHALTPEKYQEMLPFVKTNYDLAKQYELIDDSLYDKLLEMNLLNK